MNFDQLNQWNAHNLFVESSQRELEALLCNFNRVCVEMKKKVRRIGSANGETPLPEAIIQHIQSFMSGKEAARTTLLSKSWYNAWLTRPSLDFNYRDFVRQSKHKFEEFVTKTMQRYQDLTLKIDSFRLRCRIYHGLAEELIVKAMRIGANHVQLEFPCSPSIILPQEVFGSQTLVRLSISDCNINGKYVISCSNLKSLTLNNVTFTSAHVFKDIILCCILMEELSISYCGSIHSRYDNDLKLRGMNLYEFHKLRRLVLAEVDVDNMFFTEFASRFPCLKDLSIHLCHGYTRIQIATTSLETISFKPFKGTWKAEFDVPNIRKFTYLCSGKPSRLSIEAASREWEFDISIACNRFYKSCWFLKLKQYLSRFRLSRITLSMRLRCGLPDESSRYKVYSKVVGEPLVVENLMIDAPSSFCSALLIRLFEVFRPNFITHYSHTDKCSGWFFKNEFLDILCMRLMQQPITPNIGIPNQEMFGRFHLKKVNLNIYELIGAEWRPLVLDKPPDASKAPERDRKIRFKLIWED